jgi:hypothetical protein
MSTYWRFVPTVPTSVPVDNDTGNIKTQVVDSVSVPTVPTKEEDTCTHTKIKGERNNQEGAESDKSVQGALLFFLAGTVGTVGIFQR